MANAPIYQPTSIQAQGNTNGTIYNYPIFPSQGGVTAPGVTNLSPTASTSPTGVTYQTVDPNALVGNQITGLLADGNPYVENARAQGVQYGASRGLLNSAMSSGTAENAAIQGALPIAQGNAQEIAGVNAANQQAANQYTGENIAAQAQVDAAGAQVTAANIYANEQANAAKLQYQEYGQGLGLSYAQLGENDKQFLMSFGQQGAEFQSQLDQNNSQFEQGLAEDMTKFNTGIGLDMSQMDWQQYQFGVTQNMQNANDYTNMFGNIMMNPNMTADQRTSALASAQSFFNQLSQWTSAGTAFVPPWSSNPNYWSTDWSGGSTGGNTNPSPNSSP